MAASDPSAPGITIHIQNMVATVFLASPIDSLERIAAAVSNAEYNPQRFPGVIMRHREPRSTALIFKTGKMIVTGAKSEQDSKMAARKYVAIISKVGFPVRYSDANYKIQNITATVDVGFPIRLEALVYAHSARSTYEPELFPGLVFRMAEPVKAVFLIFVSGKIVITGVKTSDIMNIAVQEIYSILIDFRKNSLTVHK
jgi:transcription initiation factor TFIID TATA-box-binding protein